jgi:zinc transporter ZupT
VLLAAIACAAFLSTMVGGLLALKMHDKLHLILGFSAGAVIGVAFFDLLPEALVFGERQHGAATILSWSAAGFLLYLLVDRVLLFHGTEHAHEGRFPGRGIAGATVLCTHSFLDGAAIGIAFQASHAIGMVVAIAVLTHDFSDGINTMNIVLKNRGEHRQGLKWLLVDALAPAAGLASTLLFTLPPGATGIALALFAGFFLYIGASDLIPESYHAHPKLLTTFMTLAGAAVLYLAMSMLANAATVAVAGVAIETTTNLESSTLVLNGAGKRTRFIFDVYVAALYLPAHSSDAAKIIAADGPKRVSLTMLRKLRAEQLTDALREALDKNNTAAQISEFQPQLDAFIATMNAIGSVDSGDVVTLDFLHDGSTRLTRNGRTQGGPITGTKLQHALLTIWLGNNPVQTDLKLALLGG